MGGRYATTTDSIYIEYTKTTILPVIYAASPVPGGDTKAGLGDITQRFFSPKKPTRGG